jgi:hypothetical protein
MLSFYKCVYHHIYNVDTHERVSAKHLYELLDKGVEFNYTFRPTGESLKETLVKKYNNKKKRNKLHEIFDKSVYGPDTPLAEAKYYKCNSCKRETTNRFKCNDCWNKVDVHYEGDFVYHG